MRKVNDTRKTDENTNDDSNDNNNDDSREKYNAIATRTIMIKRRWVRNQTRTESNK